MQPESTADSFAQAAGAQSTQKRQVHPQSHNNAMASRDSACSTVFPRPNRMQEHWCRSGAHHGLRPPASIPTYKVNAGIGADGEHESGPEFNEVQSRVSEGSV